MVSVRARLRIGISSAPMRTELHLDTGGQLDVSVFGLKFVNDVDITEVGHGLFDTHFVADEPEDLLEVFEVMKDPGTNFTFKPASATLSWARPRWDWDAKWCSGSAIALKSRATPVYTPVVDELTLDIEVRVDDIEIDEEFSFDTNPGPSFEWGGEHCASCSEGKDPQERLFAHIHGEQADPSQISAKEVKALAVAMSLGTNKPAIDTIKRQLKVLKTKGVAAIIAAEAVALATAAEGAGTGRGRGRAAGGAGRGRGRTAPVTTAPL
jgi:hypothetical protein